VGWAGSAHLDLVPSALKKMLHTNHFLVGAVGNDVVKIEAYRIRYTKLEWA
jgi:hypothetical protein